MGMGMGMGMAEEVEREETAMIEIALEIGERDSDNEWILACANVSTTPIA